MTVIYDVTTNNCAARTRLTSTTIRILCPLSFDANTLAIARSVIDQMSMETIFQLGTDIMASAFWYDKDRLKNSAFYQEIRQKTNNRISVGNVTWTQNTINEHQLLITIELALVLRLR